MVFQGIPASAAGFFQKSHRIQWFCTILLYWPVSGTVRGAVGRNSGCCQRSAACMLVMDRLVRDHLGATGGGPTCRESADMAATGLAIVVMAAAICSGVTCNLRLLMANVIGVCFCSASGWRYAAPGAKCRPEP